MALPRTPVDNENDHSDTESVLNVSRDNLEDEDNIQIENITKDVDEERQRGSIMDNMIPRSTSIGNFVTHRNNNLNNNLINVDNVNVRGENSRRTAGLFNETLKTVPKFCKVCKKEAKRHAYTCKTCDKICHPICLEEEEEGTVDNLNETFVCNACVDLIRNLNNRVKTTQNPSLNKMKPSNLDVQNNYDDEEPGCSHAVRKSCNKDITNTFRHSNENNLSYSRPEMENYFVKLQYNKLPLVTDSDLTWTVFYSAFLRTKDLFDHDENILRIQNSIKDDTVKRIGGKGLFNPRTYSKCLQDVNKRLKNNTSFLTSEASALENHIRIKAENKTTLVEFFDRVRNFCTMADAYSDTSYMNNKRFLANISDVVPLFIKGKWETKQAELEDQARSPSLKDLVEIFDRELPRLEASIRNDKLRNPEKKIENKAPVKDQNKSFRFNNLNNKIHTKSSYIKGETSGNNEKNENPRFTCWFHKNNDHVSNKCRALWKMDGKAVSELAKKARICTFCGQNQHKPCPYNSKLKCRIDGCEHLHHSLFCYKRKASSFTSSNNNNNNRYQDEKDKYQTNKNPASNNTKSEKEEEVEKVLHNIANSQYYSNIPKEINEYLSRYGIQPKSCHIVTNYKNTNAKKLPMKSDQTILSVLVVTLENKRNCAFLLDTGSTVSLIEEKIANELKLLGPWLPLTLTWSGNQTRNDYYSRIIQTTVSNAFNSAQNTTSYFRTVKDLQICSQKFIASEFYSEFKSFDKLKLIDYYEIVGIIGIDNPIFFEQLETVKCLSHKGAPYTGIKSPLGDYVFGTEFPLKQIFLDLNNKKSHPIENKFMSHLNLTEKEQTEYDEMEKEVMGSEYRIPKINDNEIVTEKYALDLLEKHVKQNNNDKHYTAPLLWENEKIYLPTEESYKMSVRRYCIVEKQALRQDRFEECVQQIKNLLDKGYATEMTVEEALKPHKKAYYNPIFFIHPHNKRTRLIWDLAAKINNKCLNDYLMAGPNLYNELLEILLKMRKGKYLIKSDIGEMFHQIRVNEDDTNCLRFLFRFSQTERIRIFKMLVLPFGAKSSPVISQYVKNKIALKHQNNMPEAAETILKDSYVDDIIKSTDSYETAVRLPIEIKRMLHNGGFELLKINCTDQRVIQDIKNGLTDVELSHKKLFSHEETEKTLGYDVNFIKDEISVNINLSKFPIEILNSTKTPTRRQVLQILMSLFDPIGLIQFLTSKIKLVYHRSCIAKKAWDEEIDQADLVLWNKCLSWIKLLSSIKIPRPYCNHNSEVCKVEMWNFGDAGTEMMCGVIYLRFLNKKDEQIGLTLVHAKSFTVPVKHNRTIPQLELEVALKIAEMSHKVINILDIKLDEINYVTDNLAILEWIKKGAKKASVFVTRRLNEINKLTKKGQWRWVPSELMPADYGTKESSMPKMDFNNKWFNPDFFRLQEGNWTFASNKNFNVTFNKNGNSFDDDDNILDASKYSKLYSLINSGRLALKWKQIINYLKLLEEEKQLEEQVKLQRHNRDLKRRLKELQESLALLKIEILDETSNYKHIETLAIKFAQSNSYSNQIACLKDSKQLLKKDELYKLIPFIDDQGVLRATSRIPYNRENVEKFGLDRIYPIILPKMHPLTALYVMKYHIENHHMMTNTVIINLMKRFYIPHIRWTVKSIIKQNCFQCRRKNARPEVPLMGSLPMTRLDLQSHTFTHAIIDLAGPIIVNNYRCRPCKRYIFVGVCLTTRAVHLELIENLSAEATLIGLQNLMNLRGSPKTITTDNGTNFVGANSIMKEAHSTWSKALIKKGYIVEPIKWQFPPAKAPHMQGSVERFVGLTKKALEKMASLINDNTVKYNDFQLRAILYEIATMLNNRPLCMFPIENTSNEFLTPNHFLIGRQNIQSVPVSNKQIDDLTEHWLDIKILSNILWRHWLKAYVPMIMMREKWVDKKSPLKIDDIVILADPSVANSWRMGRVIEINAGSESQVRSVSVVLGKNKALGIKVSKKGLDKLTEKKIMKSYQQEVQSIVTRPATAVAKLFL